MAPVFRRLRTLRRGPSRREPQRRPSSFSLLGTRGPVMSRGQAEVKKPSNGVRRSELPQQTGCRGMLRDSGLAQREWEEEAGGTGWGRGGGEARWHCPAALRRRRSPRPPGQAPGPPPPASRDSPRSKTRQLTKAVFVALRNELGNF